MIALFVLLLSFCVFSSGAGVHRDLHVRTLSFPTLRSSELAWHSSRRRNGTLQKRAFGYSRRGCGNRLAIRRCERLRRCERTSLQAQRRGFRDWRSEEHTSELQSLMRISYAVFCLKKQKQNLFTKKRHQIEYNNRQKK